VNELHVKLNGQETPLRGPLAGGPPVYEFCFGKGEGYAQTHYSGFDGPEQSLEAVDVSTVGKRGDI